MTEYDYSPAAYEAAMRTHRRISTWVASQASSRPLYDNPFQLTPTEAAERAPLYHSVSPSDISFPGSPGLFARELERKRGRDRTASMGGAGARRSASTNSHGYYPQPAPRPPPTRSKTYSLAQRSSQSTSHSQSSSPRRSNSQASSPTKHPAPVYYPAPHQPVYAYPHQHRQVSYTAPAPAPYAVYPSGKVVHIPKIAPGQHAYVYPGGDVRVVPPPRPAPALLKKKPGQPFLKRLFTGWGAPDRRRRMSY